MDAVDVLRAAVDLGRDAGLRELVAQLRAQILDVTLARDARLVEGRGNALVGLRIEQALGDTAAANDYRARLLREFPDSPAAREADGTANP